MSVLRFPLRAPRAPLAALLFGLAGPPRLPAQPTLVLGPYGATLHDGGPLVIADNDFFSANDEPVSARGLISAKTLFLSWDPSYPSPYVLTTLGDLTLGNGAPGSVLHFYNIADFEQSTTVSVGAHTLHLDTATIEGNATRFELAGGTLRYDGFSLNPYLAHNPTDRVSGHGLLRRASLALHNANALRLDAPSANFALSTALDLGDDYARVLSDSPSALTAALTLGGGFLDAPAGLVLGPGGSLSGQGLIRGTITQADPEAPAPSFTASGPLTLASPVLDLGGDYTLLGSGVSALTLDQSAGSAPTVLRPSSGDLALTLLNPVSSRALTIHGNTVLTGGAYIQSSLTITGDVTGAGAIGGPLAGLSLGGSLTPTAAITAPLTFTPLPDSLIHILSTAQATWRMPATLGKTRLLAPAGLVLESRAALAPSGSRMTSVTDLRVDGPTRFAGFGYGAELLVTHSLEVGDSALADAVGGDAFIQVPDNPASPATLVFKSANRAELRGINGPDDEGGHATIHAAQGFNIDVLGSANRPSTFTVHADFTAKVIAAHLDAHGRLAATDRFVTGDSILRAADQVLPGLTSARRLIAPQGARVSADGELRFSGTGSLHLDGAWTVDGLVRPAPTIANITPTAIITVTGDLSGRGEFTRPVVFRGQGSAASDLAVLSAHAFDFTDGVLNPGRFGEAGRLRFTDLELSASPTLEMELGGLLPGTEHDVLAGSGALTLDGVLVVSLLGGFAPASGQSFALFDFASIGGSFAALQLPALTPGLAWDSSALTTTGLLSVVGTPVPEPAAATVLAGLGALLLATGRRRRGPRPSAGITESGPESRGGTGRASRVEISHGHGRHGHAAVLFGRP